MEYFKHVIEIEQSYQDMEYITGIPVGSKQSLAREIALVLKKGDTMNHITISQSQIGILNTGSIDKINAAITVSRDTSDSAIMEEIKLFSQDIVSDNEIDETKKNEILELLETLSEQIVGPKRKSVISSLINSVKKHVTNIGNLCQSLERIKI